jgi:hypothetical protein
LLADAEIEIEFALQDAAHPPDSDEPAGDCIHRRHGPQPPDSVARRIRARSNSASAPINVKGLACRSASWCRLLPTASGTERRERGEKSVVIESFTGSEIIATIGEDFTAIRDELDQFSR